jgi:Rrf2 family nitric oxide-sensitive transcriptional repressor
MHLTKHTDYALRTLLLVAAKDPQPITAEAVADAFVINRHHLTKVVQTLVAKGYLHGQRGPGGGLTLARAPTLINIAAVVKDFEPDFALLECFEPATSTCPITEACALRGVLGEASRAFMDVLMEYSLADALGAPNRLLKKLEASAQQRAQSSTAVTVPSHLD